MDPCLEYNGSMSAQCGKFCNHTLSVVCSIGIYVLHCRNLVLSFDPEINNYVCRLLYSIYVRWNTREQSPYYMHGFNLKPYGTINTPRQPTAVFIDLRYEEVDNQLTWSGGIRSPPFYDGSLGDPLLFMQYILRSMAGVSRLAYLVSLLKTVFLILMTSYTKFQFMMDHWEIHSCLCRLCSMADVSRFLVYFP